MSIEEQLEIVESNIAEYGVCDITIEEYRHLKQQIRADAIDDVERELLASGFIFTEHALEVWHGIADKLKEQK